MTTTSIQHLVWDWNGTLLNDLALSLKTINIMLARRGLPHLDADGYRAIFDFPVRDCYALLGFDVDDPDVWHRITEEFHALYGAEAASAPLRADVMPHLNTFRDQGFGMSVLSASEETILNETLASRDILHYFQTVHGLSDRYGGTKAALAEHMVDTLALAPDTILFVGDTTHDHDVASRIGCPCVLLTGGHQSEARLKTCGCPVLRDLDELHETIKKPSLRS